MMTPDESKTVTSSYRRFISNETVVWTDYDDRMVVLDYLSDVELCREVLVLLSKKGIAKTLDHNDIDASMIIIKLFNETDSLHVKNRYVLQNVLSYYKTNKPK